VLLLLPWHRGAAEIAGFRTAGCAVGFSNCHGQACPGHDLWCASARAQAVLADNSISISPGELQNTQCEPDRQTRDAELLTALAQVTNWRRQGDIVELLGVTPLRFRLMTN
jgi:hypothetical protein